MPLGAARIALFSRPQVVAQAEVIRAKVGVSAVGTAQISHTESVFSGSSAEFNGNSDYLNGFADTVAFGDSDYTVECWVRTNASGYRQHIIDSRSDNGNGFYITIEPGLDIIFHHTNTKDVTGSINTNTWYHIAQVRSGNIMEGFVNGQSIGTVDVSSVQLTQTNFRIAANLSPNLSTLFSGNIDEVRISNTARYTANFTPQTEPFVNDENTLLLLHMDGTPGSQFFEDDNGVRPRESTRAVGSAAISTAQSQFGGSSLELTGSPDIVEIQDKTYFDLQQPQWCVETWFYQETFSSGLSVIIGKRSNNFGWLYYTVGNDLVFNRLGSDNITATGVISQNTWHHTATVRDGNDYYLFLDGQLVAQEFYTDETTVRRANVEIGRDPTDGTRYWDGYIDEVRISNTARYTANFTPQTEPFVNDENTLLLLHMDGTDGSIDFPDDNGVRSKIGVSAVGNAQISTTESQFGGASAEFDGSGDYLITPSKDDWNLTQDQYTIETWFRTNTVSNSLKMLTSKRNDPSDSGTGWMFYIDNSDLVWNLIAITPNITASSVISVDTWHHAAICRNQDSYELYLDGSLVASATITSNTVTNSQPVYIGRDQTNTSRDWNGYIDEFRISNTARYSTNFTPPTEPFQNDDNTLLLLHMDGTDGSQTFVDDNGVPPNWDYGA